MRHRTILAASAAAVLAVAPLAAQTTQTTPTAPSAAPRSDGMTTPAPGTPTTQAPATGTRTAPPTTTTQTTPPAGPATTTPPAATTDRAAPAGQRADRVNSENAVHVMIDGGQGMRSSRLIGADVYNGAGEDARDIGEIDDIILGPDKNARTAVLSVGGFLGIGTRYVAVPFDQLQIAPNGRVVMPGATVESLRAQPEFNYRTAAAR